MTTPIVAIVGRPNVGKSTLFNRLVGRGEAIVHDSPGVTRDRHYADAFVRGRELTLVDTGGFDPDSPDPVASGIARQVRVAIEEADAVVCVLDATSPPTEADGDAVALLRQSGVRVVYVANKSDNPRTDHEAGDLYRLGLDRLIAVSALHGRGTADLEAALVDALPERPEPAEAEVTGPTRIALIGRPNAGKSTLFNHLAGSERSLVTDVPGTTRDPIDEVIEWQGREYLLVDTAGIRRKSRIRGDIEAASVMRAIRAASRAQIVVLMTDAAIGLSEQEQRLLGLCAERGRAVVVALNKVDLLDKTGKKAAIEKAKDELRFARWAPILTLSAKTGRGVDAVMKTVTRAADEYGRRVKTGELNRFFEGVLSRNPPPTSGGRAPRLFFVTQAETSPPVFVAVTDAPANIKASYRRYVVNQLRKEFGFESVPVQVRYRLRKRR